jgi:hypothetical protein
MELYNVRKLSYVTSCVSDRRMRRYQEVHDRQIIIKKLLALPRPTQSMPYERPTPGWPKSQPGVGHPQGEFLITKVKKFALWTTNTWPAIWVGYPQGLDWVAFRIPYQIEGP